MTAEQDSLRQLQPQWNKTLVAASIAISFLGAFTSTQLLCHARMASQFSSVFIWAMLGSLIFGWCSVWSFHFLAMLAYEFDLPIDVDAPMTILSSILAVFFTFIAVAADLLWDRYRSGGRNTKRRKGRNYPDSSYLNARKIFKRFLRPANRARRGSNCVLSVRDADDDDEENGLLDAESSPSLELRSVGSSPDRDGLVTCSNVTSCCSCDGSLSQAATLLKPNGVLDIPPHDCQGPHRAADVTHTVSSMSTSLPMPRQSEIMEESGLRDSLSSVYRAEIGPKKSVFHSTAGLMYHGFTLSNIAKGFLWSTALTSMHYVGIFAVEIPAGFFKFNPWLVALSGLIGWAVCTVGCIFMSQMETNLPQQILFSLIAVVGIAALHFTGMAATTFWSTAAVSDVRGFPPALANSVVAIAFLTCITANVLVAHSATVSRNKLAEIIWTRKELWRTIALKEHAEAAARARSEFIASASHEIRTPLHHLQGYGDLLAQTELTEEGRALLNAIQRATKTLSLITNNVLDWSKFEQNSEAAYRPTALDIRTVCESIIILLPNVDDDASVQLYVVVAPDVPETLFLDETWIHRILMNLLSNALKFTRSGYILLSIQMRDDNLIAIVEDTGCGLDPAFIPEMWTPFKQGEVRGSARGTGLGLSIIKQLLHRMNGSIEVESKYEYSEGVGPEKSGTKFTVRIPMPSTICRSETLAGIESRPKVAIFSTNGPTRSMEGLRQCWELSGFDVTMLSRVSDLSQSSSWKYVWADLHFLNQDVSQFQELLQMKEKWHVLVPYDTLTSLESLPGIMSAPNIIMLQKPLIWHTFGRSITARSETPSRTLRFAAEVEVMNGEMALEQQCLDPLNMKYTILLVEDNSINQRLGKKMLLTLGYSVVTATNGQDAIEQLLKSEVTNFPPTPPANNPPDPSQSPAFPHIDAILMDQSMPRKDGITATREIRALESAGILQRRTPIIAVTAVVNGEAQSLFKDAGADDFLAKPLSLEKLREALLSQLSRI